MSLCTARTRRRPDARDAPGCGGASALWPRARHRRAGPCRAFG
jgi:hypothetical protein